MREWNVHVDPRVLNLTSPGLFNPEERISGAYWIRSGACVDILEKRRNSCPIPGIEKRLLGRSASSQSLYWPSYSNSSNQKYCVHINFHIANKHGVIEFRCSTDTSEARYDFCSAHQCTKGSGKFTALHRPHGPRGCSQCSKRNYIHSKCLSQRVDIREPWQLVRSEMLFHKWKLWIRWCGLVSSGGLHWRSHLVVIRRFIKEDEF